VDERNLPVDPVFVEAANHVGVNFFLYRARELNDDSLAWNWQKEQSTGHPVPRDVRP